MIRLWMKKLNVILIKKLQKYLSYHQVKLSINILQVKKYYLLIKNK